jgi:hypothetical protein
VAVRRVELTIDRLVLRGIDPAHREALVEGLQTELQRLLAAPETSAARPGKTPVLRVGGLRLEPGHQGARKLGGSVATAIGKGILP